MGKMLGGEEEKDPDAQKKEEERQEALRQQEEERKAKYAKMEAERENIRQGIRDKVRKKMWVLQIQTKQRQVFMDERIFYDSFILTSDFCRQQFPYLVLPENNFSVQVVYSSR